MARTGWKAHHAEEARLGTGWHDAPINPIVMPVRVRFAGGESGCRRLLNCPARGIARAPM
jgi:hypothetical protein